METAKLPSAPPTRPKSLKRRKVLRGLPLSECRPRPARRRPNGRNDRPQNRHRADAYTRPVGEGDLSSNASPTHLKIFRPTIALCRNGRSLRT